MVKWNIPAILRGCDTGRMQSVGFMQVIPLLSNLEDERFVSGGAEVEVFTTSYGTMGFKNKQDACMIVPSNAAYVVKQAAQDHAMTRAAVVPGRKSHSFKDAMCIQASQGGMISSEAHQLRILPYALRETAMKQQGKKDYSKLWQNIAAFNKSMGAGTESNLVAFYKTFARELEEFTAQFENVPGQVGAVILVGGVVIGVERTPSQEYWRKVWKPLIRDCYGSYALSGKLTEPQRVPLKSGARSLQDIARALEDAETVESDTAKRAIREMLDEEFKFKGDDEVQKLLKGHTKSCKIGTIENDQFIGQMIYDDRAVPYASLVAREVWRDPKRNSWRMADLFKI